MKNYELLLSADGSEQQVLFNDKKYQRLSDAHHDLMRIMDTIEENPGDFQEDAGISIVRKSGRKGQKPETEELVRMLCGRDEDDGDFCYEGLYFNTKCSDFENMILLGEKKNSWTGKYSVQVAGAEFNLCVFSHLDMIMQSIEELKQHPQDLVGRIMQISRKNDDETCRDLCMLLYTQDEKTGALKLQTRIQIDETDSDYPALSEFIAQEQEKLNPAAAVK